MCVFKLSSKTNCKNNTPEYYCRCVNISFFNSFILHLYFTVLVILSCFPCIFPLFVLMFISVCLYCIYIYIYICNYHFLVVFVVLVSLIQQ